MAEQEKRRTREADLLGLAPLLMFLVMTTRQVDLSLEEFYVFMFLLLMVKVILYRLDNPKEAVFRIGEYRFSALPYQALMGIVVGLAATSLLFFLGTYRPLADPVGEFVTQALFVAFVETLLMVVLVQTVHLRVPVRLRAEAKRTEKRPNRFEWTEAPIGIVAWPLAFGFLHPAVREAWLAGDFSLMSFGAFAYGVFWAILFFAFFWLRDHSGKASVFFGAVTVWVMHIVANLVIMTYKTEVAGFEFFPVEVGAVPMVEWVMPVTLVLTLGLGLLPFRRSLSSWFAQRRRSIP
jgi:hypothetical protein